MALWNKDGDFEILQEFDSTSKSGGVHSDDDDEEEMSE